MRAKMKYVHLGRWIAFLRFGGRTLWIFGGHQLPGRSYCHQIYLGAFGVAWWAKP